MADEYVGPTTFRIVKSPLPTNLASTINVVMEPLIKSGVIIPLAKNGGSGTDTVLDLSVNLECECYMTK